MLLCQNAGEKELYDLCEQCFLILKQEIPVHVAMLKAIYFESITQIENVFRGCAHKTPLSEAA
jgi:hypothetical protein